MTTEIEITSYFISDSSEPPKVVKGSTTAVLEKISEIDCLVFYKIIDWRYSSPDIVKFVKGEIIVDKRTKTMEIAIETTLIIRHIYLKKCGDSYRGFAEYDNKPETGYMIVKF